MVFRAPVTRGVAPGAPRAQRCVGFNLTGSVAEDVVVRETGVAAGDLQGVTWPALIHTADLEVLLPRWIERTGDVREATGLWESDMIAFLGLHRAAATLGGFGNAPKQMRADTLTPQGVRLRYVNCPVTPFIDNDEQNVCEGK